MMYWAKTPAKKLIFQSHKRVYGELRLSHHNRSRAWQLASEPHRKSQLPGSASELHSLSFRLWQDDKPHLPLVNIEHCLKEAPGISWTAGKNFTYSSDFSCTALPSYEPCRSEQLHGLQSNSNTNGGCDSNRKATVKNVIKFG